MKILLSFYGVVLYACPDINYWCDPFFLHFWTLIYLNNELPDIQESKSILVIPFLRLNYLNVTAVAVTPTLYPKPRTSSSLIWNKLHDHSGVRRTPSDLAGKQSTMVNWPLAYNLFLLYMTHALTVGPYADSFKLSYTTTISCITDTIHSGFG